ncbi:MAG: hypothetical protein WD077_15135 [Bacteroidia bacterium]
MKNLIWILSLLMIITISCGSPDSGEQRSSEDTEAEKKKERSPKKARFEISTEGWNEYENQAFGLRLVYPKVWKVMEDSTTFPNAIINIYSSRSETIIELPLNVHAPAGATYVGIFPEGYGTELPRGTIKSLQDWDGEAPVNFSLNLKESKVLLLENDRQWAYFLKPAKLPSGWNEQGFIFAQIAVDSFEAKCIDGVSGAEKTLDECDEMQGDIYRRHGKLHRMYRMIVPGILRSIHFTEAGSMKGAGAE